MALNNDDIKQLIAILQKGLLNEEETEPVKPVKKTKKVKKETNQNANIQTKENKFVTLGLDSLHREDIAIDKKLRKNPPTPRNRTFHAISVRCRSCGKQESISPSLLYDSPDRYKCNKCSSSPG